ncbi:MAG: transglycosylase domain-containing protein [Actinomycetota bacterium]|nr:transglycosylase domain-containing protein [Actinomycetota bacterium]
MSMSAPPGHRPGPIAILVRIAGMAVAAVLAGVLVALMLTPFVGAFGTVTRDIVQSFESLPDDLSTPPLPQRSLILASDGSVLATLYYQNRVEVPLTSISPLMRQATVAIEDSRFLDHNGVDLRGVLRSIVSNVDAGGIEQGSSTLTMQYVKNVLVNQATSADELDAARGDSATRKLREIRYALGLEKIFTKEQILERYLNIAYFGAGAYGVEAAARRYFSKSAADLTLPEAATLAGIVQRPTAYDPLRNPELSTTRRNIVIKRMADLGFVTPQEADRASLLPMGQVLNPTLATNGCTSSYAPFFCDYVVQTIRSEAAFGATPDEREAFLRRGGYTIRTTLDPKAQQAAFETVTSYIPTNDASRRAAAISMVQPGTGNVIAMTQNREWGTSGRGKTTYNYNVGRDKGGTIGMQAGSIFKIFTLAAAFEAGVSPYEYVSAYSPKTFEGFTNCTTGEKFEPVTVRNSTTSGTLNMAQATAYSTNTYFMTIEERVGLCRPAEIAESMGVTLGNGDPLLRVPSFTLGTMEVTPLMMANAYATFAAHGIYCKPVVILDIRDRDGNALPVPSGDCKRVIKREVADNVTYMLNGVVNGGISGRTGQAMALEKRQVAGKTGTTNDSAAVWFAGYTPQLAAAVWVGDPRGGYAYPMKAVTIKGTYYSQVFGGTIPGPIWRDAMEAALIGTEPEDFEIRSSYGWSTSGPNDYVYVPPPPSDDPAPADPADPPTFDNSEPTEPPAEPSAEPAPPEPAPVDPGASTPASG